MQPFRYLPILFYCTPLFHTNLTLDGNIPLRMIQWDYSVLVFKACSAFSATCLAPINTRGTPFPGLVLAPQYNTLGSPVDFGPGRVRLSWANPWLCKTKFGEAEKTLE